MKVSPKVQSAGSMSWTSYYVRILIKICYFPIYMEGEKVTFSLLSLKTFIHFTLNIGIFIGLFLLTLFLSGFIGLVEEKIKRVSTTYRQAFVRAKKHICLIHLVI